MQFFFSQTHACISALSDFFYLFKPLMNLRLIFATASIFMLLLKEQYEKEQVLKFF